jgi:predicted Zn-dependent protease
MELMDSEDELASVLGHEIEHIDHYHCAERVQLEARARKLRLGALAVLAAIPIEVFQVGYSKAQELEADR